MPDLIFSQNILPISHSSSPFPYFFNKTLTYQNRNFLVIKKRIAKNLCHKIIIRIFTKLNEEKSSFFTPSKKKLLMYRGLFFLWIILGIVKK
jgi:ATP-dependent helicase/DNAse subunit B